MIQLSKTLAFSIVILLVVACGGAAAPTATPTRPVATATPQPTTPTQPAATATPAAIATPTRPAVTATPTAATPAATVAPAATLPPTFAPPALDISAKDFEFSQKEIVAQAGQTLRINYKNEGTRTHNLLVHGYEALNNKIGPNLAGGQSKGIEVAFDKAGLYPFFCPVGQHENAGMIGTLKVEGPSTGQPSIKVYAPGAAKELIGPKIIVAVSITGFALDEANIGKSPNKPGSGHWHLLLDGQLVNPTANLIYTLDDVGLGQHTIKAELHNNDHSPLTPPVEDSVTFSVVPRPTPTPPPATPTRQP